MERNELVQKLDTEGNLLIKKKAEPRAPRKAAGEKKKAASKDASVVAAPKKTRARPAKKSAEVVVEPTSD